MKITGTLIKKLDIQLGTSKAGKEWSKKSFIIEQEDNYSTQVCIDVMGDKIDEFEKMEIGNCYDIGVNISSREYNGKYYTNINGWRIDNKIASTSKAEDDSEDLPF